MKSFIINLNNVPHGANKPDRSAKHARNLIKFTPDLLKFYKNVDHRNHVTYRRTGSYILL